MLDRRVFVTCVALAVGLGPMIAGCSGPDQGVITFSERPSKGTGTDTSSSDDSPAPAAPVDTGASAGAVNTVFVSDAYPALSPACASCHLSGTSGAPIFFGSDASATYPLFKGRNFHLPNSVLVTKGAHLGPALTTEQRAAVDEWVAAEGGGAPDGG